jgi:polyhydroxyalkanoate synthesis regulator phasin
MTKAAKKNTIVTELSGVIDDVVEQTEKALDRGRRIAFDVIPERAEELADDLAKQTRKVSNSLDKRRKQAVKQAEKRAAQLDKRREGLVKRVGKQIDRVVSAVEKGLADVVRPVAKRLDIASNTEVTALKRRLAQIEKKVGVAKTAKRTSRKTGTRRKKAA